MNIITVARIIMILLSGFVLANPYGESISGIYYVLYWVWFITSIMIMLSDGFWGWLLQAGIGGLVVFFLFHIFIGILGF